MYFKNFGTDILGSWVTVKLFRVTHALRGSVDIEVLSF